LSNYLNKLGTWKLVFIITGFILILVGARLLWIATFNHTDHSNAIHGQLDLREWDAQKERTISLDGEWEFYPYEWLNGQDEYERSEGINPQLIKVPGGWNKLLQPDKSTPYGYGSYRLRILVDPAQDLNYSLRLSSVRSASKLYVNGRLLGGSGEIGESRDNYAAQNIPYTATFTANSSGVIDIVIQAANFQDPRRSGITRSIKFGTESAIARETQLSTSMQQMDAIVFIGQAICAIMLYLAGYREKRLLYFALLVFCITMMNTLGNQEKLLQYWFNINYEWSFRLIHLFMIGIVFGLLESAREQMLKYWPRIFKGFIIFCAVDTILAFLMPVNTMIQVQSVILLGMIASIIFTILSMVQMSLTNLKDNLLMVLSVVAVINNFIWWVLSLYLGFKVVYYPFDLIIATTCLVGVWFKHYLKVSAETSKLAAKLQRTDKHKDEFLANTSHELRNPLHGILNIAQSVLEREQHSLDEKSVRDLKTVLSVGRRMSLMLHDLLDARRLQEGTPRFDLRNVSLHTIATGVIDILRSMTEGSKVKLLNQVPEHFPQVYADENRVIQIVFNLLHNAVKYTHEGEITIRGQVVDGQAYISVTDTGIGMDEETLQRIIEPYEQADHDKTMVEGGFGLGLSISKQLIELQGGTLQFNSILGQGSQFIFTLPLAGEEGVGKGGTESGILAITSYPEVAVAGTDSLDTFSNPQHKLTDGARILIVDDDPVNLNVLETILSLEPYEIMTVTSAREALTILDTMEWDLVISDVMMPQMSGYELTRSIRERFTLTELPVLLLTARSHPKDIENGFLSGANDYVTKPVEAMEIRSRVRALTAVKQSVRERLQMEAAWLQAQIQPHFLFNTLNAISALSEIDLDRMRNLLDVFSNFLRSKFKMQNMDQLAPIEEELSIVRSYLFIEKERFEERLNVVWDIDDNKQLKVPLLTIQPLVENAVRHGIMKRVRGGTISIRVENRDTYAEITVEDDGIGMDEEIVLQIMEGRTGSESGVGLLNTNLRLKRHYGEGLRIQSKPGQGTSISFIIHKNKWS